MTKSDLVRILKHVDGDDTDIMFCLVGQDDNAVIRHIQSVFYEGIFTGGDLHPLDSGIEGRKALCLVPVA